MNIKELIEYISNSNEGKVFLINLFNTINPTTSHYQQSDLPQVNLIKKSLNLFLTQNNVINFIKSSKDITYDVQRYISNNEIWKIGSNPNIDGLVNKKNGKLSRIISYKDFYNLIRTAQIHVKGISFPGPNENDLIDKINGKYIDDGSWKKYFFNGYKIRIPKNNYIWLTDANAVDNFIKNKEYKENIADTYRNILGLSHYCAGSILIRMNFNIKSLLYDINNNNKIIRRPHGACNGGIRFRMIYQSSSKINNQWGKTTNLFNVLQKKYNIDGIPELLTNGLDYVSLDYVDAEYLGMVLENSEFQHEFFIKKIRKTESIETIKQYLIKILL